MRMGDEVFVSFLADNPHDVGVAFDEMCSTGLGLSESQYWFVVEVLGAQTNAKITLQRLTHNILTEGASDD